MKDMKNKRWKRATKRVIGECQRVTGKCVYCNYRKECDRLEEGYDGHLRFSRAFSIIVDIREAYDIMKVCQ